MEILPAIDIKDGHVVRLYQGDYRQVTTFPESVVEAGRRWADLGARWLHVVDLDGARTGRPAHTDLILAVRRAVGIRMEVGGGLRTVDDVARLLDAGIDRVILGTAALDSPALVDAVLARDPAALAVALDARDGVVATGGWLAASGQRAEAVAAALAARGVRVFSHTDIARDGALGGPNYAALRAVQAALGGGPNPPTPFPAGKGEMVGGPNPPTPFPAGKGEMGGDPNPPTPFPRREGGEAGPVARGGEVQLIAAGGVATLEDVRALAAMGLSGAIIGRALYTGAIGLPEALRMAMDDGR